MTEHHCEDILLQGMQLGIVRGIICTDIEHAVDLFGQARATVIGGVMYTFEERSQYYCPRKKHMVQQDHMLLTPCKRNKMGREYVLNACSCPLCTHQTDWTPDAIYSSGCIHIDFWSTMRVFPNPRSFAKWLVENSFPYIPLLDSGVQALVDQQMPSCRNEITPEERRSLLAPPESLSDL